MGDIVLETERLILRKIDESDAQDDATSSSEPTSADDPKGPGKTNFE